MQTRSRKIRLYFQHRTQHKMLHIVPLILWGLLVGNLILLPTSATAKNIGKETVKELAQDTTQDDVSRQLNLDALPDALVEPIAQLIAPINEDDEDETGILTAANEQSRIAVQHTGFLQNSLTDADLPEVRRHTEHIINILDGENGMLFGDLDRDGQPQNPGNGVGLRVYVEDALAPSMEIVSAIEDDEADDDALLEFANQTVDAMNASPDNVTDALAVAVKIFAADTIAEAQPFADDLTEFVTDLDAMVSIAFTSTYALHDAFEPVETDRSLTADLSTEIAASVVLSSSQLISNTVLQSETAVRHTGFLQSSLSETDLPEVRRHTEHIINTLDGESGVLYGDLDRDGQAQNPGDGIGIRVYVDDVATLIEQLDSEIIASDSVQEIADTLSTSSDLVDEATNIGLKVFASDTITETQGFGDKLTELVAELHEQNLVAQAGIDALTVPVGDAPVPGFDQAEAQANLETLVTAEEQAQIAVQHTGFLQNSLTDADLDEARRHTEHIVNMLDGETGDFFGDLDRDGQPQNPGDGVGVRTYFANVLPFAEATAATGTTPATESLLIAITTGADSIDEAMTVALKVFAADTVTETQVFGDQLTAIVATVYDQSVAAQASISALPSRASRESTTTEDASVASLVDVAEAQSLLDLLVVADEQAQIAVQHTGFLQNSLTDADLPEARRHTEHIVNILDGEGGILFGDLDRDGQGQNPGDGVGIRTYLDDAAAQAVLAFGDLSVNEDVEPFASTALGVIDSLDAGVLFVPLTFEQALQLFASDTITDALGFAEELTEQVGEIGASIASANASTLELVQAASGMDETETDETETDETETDETETDETETDETETEDINAEDADPVDTDTADADTEPSASDSASRNFSLTGPPSTGTSGELWESPSDNASYIFVPAGGFTIGVIDGLNAAANERPAHTLVLDEYWIAQTETTNAQYKRCVDAGVCTPPDNERWNLPEFVDHPVTHVDWAQANVYARWAGGRLPTEGEWEKACHGLSLQTYPWGEEPPTAELGNVDGSIGDNGSGDTTAVGSYPDGASPLGLLDMSGNVQEWTANLELAYPYFIDDGREDLTVSGDRVVRGGAYGQTQFLQRCTARSATPTESASASLGFRIVLNTGRNVWSNPIDNAPYVLIPAGDFVMGSAPDDAVDPNELPQHDVSLDAFWLQQTETTNARYGLCVDAGVCTPPASEEWAQATYAEHPVTHVDWEQAATYAEWVGGRLPTEAEWEKACRGTDQRLYPWGNQSPSAELSNYNYTIGETTPVGSYPAGASPYGVLDISGNVWEWTSSLGAAYPFDAADGREDPADDGERVARGGSYYYTQYQLRCTTRTETDPGIATPQFGFRVVVSDLE